MRPAVLTLVFFLSFTARVLPQDDLASQIEIVMADLRERQSVARNSREVDELCSLLEKQLDDLRKSARYLGSVKLQTWTHASGKYSIRARVAQLSSSYVTFLRQDATEASYKRSILSSESNKILDGYLASHEAKIKLLKPGYDELSSKYAKAAASRDELRGKQQRLLPAHQQLLQLQKLASENEQGERVRQAQDPFVIVSITDRDRLRKDLHYILGDEGDDEISRIVEQWTQGLHTKPTGEAYTLAYTLADQSSGALMPSLLLSADQPVMLGDLPQRYDYCVLFNFQTIPPKVKEAYFAQQRVAFERMINDQESGVTAEEQEAVRKAGEAQIAQIEEVVPDTDRVFMGWAVDMAGQKTYVDVAAQFVAGTKRAEQFDELVNLKSDYTTLKLPGSVANFRATFEISDETDKEDFKQTLRSSLASLKTLHDNPDVDSAFCGRRLRGPGHSSPVC